MLEMNRLKILKLVVRLLKIHISNLERRKHFKAGGFMKCFRHLRVALCCSLGEEDWAL